MRVLIVGVDGGETIIPHNRAKRNDKDWQMAPHTSEPATIRILGLGAFGSAAFYQPALKGRRTRRTEIHPVHGAHSGRR
jgi:hypothetical protein